MKVSYEWLQTFFAEGKLPSPEDVAHTLTFHAFEIEGIEEVGNTSVIDVDVLPNRASDSLSHRGIAREISALLNIPMEHDPLRQEIELTPATDSITVTLDNNASCSQYISARISNVSIGESPQWLKDRLEAIGQKSINNVVDATNYVLFSLGQPTHVFDAKKLTGEKINVGTRLAKKDERIVLLGGTEVTLNENMSIIVDTASDTPIAVAGVKGGVAAEVTDETTDIIVESAKFNPVETRKTAQALKMRTDASARFENDVPDLLPIYGAHALVQLILEIAGGELVGYATGGGVVEENKSVSITAQRVSQLLGADITDTDMEDIFTRLDFTHTKDGENFIVTAPFERTDILIPEDVIEEIGRVYGYNKIQSQQLEVPKEQPAVNKKFAYTEHIRTALAQLGITETYLYSLRDTGDVALRNALASDKDHLRPALSDGLLEALDKNEHNMPLLGMYESLSLFEIGNVFSKKGEATHVAIAVRFTAKKKKEEKTKEFLLNVKSALEDILQTTLPEPKGEILEFNLDAILDALPELNQYPEAQTVGDDVAYESFSQYPFMLRDIAVWVPAGTSLNAIESIIQSRSGVLLKRCDLFDTFSKDERTSYAFHLVFQSMAETLTDERIGDIMRTIEEEMSTQNGWEIR